MEQTCRPDKCLPMVGWSMGLGPVGDLWKFTVNHIAWCLLGWPYTSAPLLACYLELIPEPAGGPDLTQSPHARTPGAKQRLSQIAHYSLHSELKVVHYIGNRVPFGTRRERQLVHPDPASRINRWLDLSHLPSQRVKQTRTQPLKRAESGDQLCPKHHAMRGNHLRVLAGW